MQLSIAMTSSYVKRNRFFQDSLKTKQGNTIEPVAHKQGKPIDTKSFDTQNLKVILMALAARFSKPTHLPYVTIRATPLIRLL